MPIVTLLTDFGLHDTFVGVMKGVILSRAPNARIVDLTHDVSPQAVVSGAFLLETARRYFPAGTVHVAVVDPGVGTARRRIALEAEGHLFIGPDNGLLSAALPDAARRRRIAGESYEAQKIRLPSAVRAFVIENEALFLQPVSATFEGRDVFSPVAGYLAAGGSLEDAGTPSDHVLALPAFRAPRREDGIVQGLVLHIDRFGNLITDIRLDDLPPAPLFSVAGRDLRLAQTYGAASGAAAIVSSAGTIEIAVPNASAALALDVGIGSPVLVRPGEAPAG